MNIKLIDLFCGAGGLTTGASQVDGVEIIACVNHDDVAISSHKANHKEVLHFTEDVRNREMISHLRALVAQHRKKDPGCKIILWASLECTNFSKAKGGLPRDGDSRTLADCLDWYIEAFDPDGLWIENVEEFMAWGPLDENGKPVSRRSGLDYLRFIDRIQSYGYKFDYRILNSADFGAYTSRKRYFAQFVKHDLPVTWPTPTHSRSGELSHVPSLPFERSSSLGGTEGRFKKWKAVKDVLDFSVKGESIFTRSKPLSENTLKRIYAGLVKYVAGGDDSFLKKYYSGRPAGKVISVKGPSGAITTIDGHALVQCEFLTQYNGGGHDQRIHSIENPSTTISTNNRHALISPEFLVKYYGTAKTSDIDQPAGTITTKDRMAAVWLDKNYSGPHNHQTIERPAGSVLTNDKHQVVEVRWVMNTNFQNVGKSIEEPSSTIMACRKHHYLMNPQFASKGGSTDDPCFTLIARMDKKPPHLVQIQPVTPLGDGGFAILIYENDSDTMRNIKLFMAAYGISDIYMRMLMISELLAIQGFPEGYILEGTKTQQKKFIGNSVEVNQGRVLLQAQYDGFQVQKQNQLSA